MKLTGTMQLLGELDPEALKEHLRKLSVPRRSNLSAEANHVIVRSRVTTQRQLAGRVATALQELRR